MVEEQHREKTFLNRIKPTGMFRCLCFFGTIKFVILQIFSATKRSLKNSKKWKIENFLKEKLNFDEHQKKLISQKMLKYLEAYFKHVYHHKQLKVVKEMMVDVKTKKCEWRFKDAVSRSHRGFPSIDYNVAKAFVLQCDGKYSQTKFYRCTGCD